MKKRNHQPKNWVLEQGNQLETGDKTTCNSAIENKYNLNNCNFYNKTKNFIQKLETQNSTILNSKLKSKPRS